MVHRSQMLQEFLTATQEAISARTGTNTSAAIAVQRISAPMDISGSASDSIKPRTLPACSFLDPAIAGAKQGPTDIARVASAINGLAPELCWRLKTSGDPVFANGHANADILGSVPEALEQRDDVRIGLSLMAPGITYPDHSHPPRRKCTLHFRAVSGGTRLVHGTNRAWAEYSTIPEALPTRCVQVANHSWRSGVCRLIEAIGFKFHNHRHDWYSPQNRGLQRKPTLACPATTMVTARFRMSA